MVTTETQPEAAMDACDLVHAGQIHAAVDALRDLRAASPECETTARLLAWAMTHDERATESEIDQAHHDAFMLVASPLPSLGGFTPDTTGRPIRLGLLSAGFCAHPVASTIEPLLLGADPDRLQIIGYSLTEHRDAVTSRMFKRSAGWRELAGLDDAASAHQIMLDRIDVLIDLAGDTPEGRPGITARRPAPVQLAGMAHASRFCAPFTDARLTDAVIDPVSRTASNEQRPLRIEGSSISYVPPHDAAPPMDERRAAGPVRFGAFASGQRLSATSLRLFARVLTTIPESTLTIKSRTLGSPNARVELSRHLTSLGVDPGRVRMLPPAATAEGHLALHREIDIALDTTPVAAASATCDALWMGVPVISLAGSHPSSRLGASILQAAGCSEWVCNDPTEYTERCVTLAAQVDHLRANRTTLHDKVTASPLCNAAAYADRFATALEAHLHQQTSLPKRTAA
ncbi:MAG: hypothetical protein AAGB51_10170 [Planctomycetota bacterium]